MSRSTPRMNFTYPNFRKSPWDNDFNTLIREIDDAVYTSREDRNLVLMEGGTISWAAGTGVLQWSDILYLNASITGFLWRVPADSVTIEEGEVLYAELTRNPGSNVDVVTGVASQVPSTNAAVLLCIRKGDLLYWRDGKVIPDGYSGTLFIAGSVAETLANTLVAGNVTGGRDIVVSSGDKLTAPDYAVLTVETPSPTAGIPGGIDLTSGSGLQAGRPGADIDITAGDGATTGAGGTVNVTPGSSPTGTDGTIELLGDTNVTGKLGVTGLIDPVGVVFDEASAPGTGATQGGVFVSDGTGGLTQNKLYFRPGSNGTPEELGAGGATSTAMARVDPSSSDAVDDTDLTTAFLTVQGGVDAIVSAGGGTVYVFPKFGGYAETVFVHDPDVHICGVGPETSWGTNTDSAKVVIRPDAAGPAIVYTEASRASAQALIARGAANYETFYDTDLVYGGRTPNRCSVSNIYLQTSATYALCLWGKNSNSTQFQDALRVSQCRVEGIYSQRVGDVSYKRCQLATLRSYNTYSNYFEHTFLNALVEEYDPLKAVPAFGYFGVLLESCNVNGLLLYVEAAVQEMVSCWGDGVYQLYDDSFLHTQGLQNERTPTGLLVSTDAEWQGHADHFLGGVQFNTGGTDQACTAVDCYIEGLLTDNNGRLTQSGSFRDNVAAEFGKVAQKVTPVAADHILIEDSAAGFAKKYALFSAFGGSAAVFEVDSGNNEIQPILADKGRTFLVGSQSTEDTGAAADDGRMFFHKTDNSFRAGRVLGTQWDSANRGSDSAALNFGCIASGVRSLAGGSNSTAAGGGSRAFGYNCDTDASASGSCSKGYYARGMLRGQSAHSCGEFSVAGDAQYSRLTAVASTTGAVTVEMFLDGAAIAMNLLDDRTWAFEMLFVARHVGGVAGTLGDSAAYKAQGCVRRRSGAAAIVGAVTYTVLAEDDASWPTPVVDATSVRLRVRVTGVTDQNIRWVAAVHLTEVKTV